MLNTLFLTVCTCISSGCGKTALSNDVGRFKNTTNEVIIKAANDYTYKNYALSYSQYQSFVKQKLIQHAKDNSSFDSDKISSIECLIRKDPFYVNAEYLDSIFLKSADIKNDSSDGALNLRAINISKREDVKKLFSPQTIDSRILTIDFNNIYVEPDGLGGSSSAESVNGASENQPVSEQEIDADTVRLPILPYHSESVSSSFGGKIDGCDFFGILCSKDACVNIYDVLAGFLNNQMVYRASGSGTPFEVIFAAFNALSTVTAAGAAAAALISGVIAKITIVGMIIGLVGAACIGTLVAMIVFGFLGKGFAVGWKIHADFSWEWFCGSLD